MTIAPTLSPLKLYLKLRLDFILLYDYDLLAFFFFTEPVVRKLTPMKAFPMTWRGLEKGQVLCRQIGSLNLTNTCRSHPALLSMQQTP